MSEFESPNKVVFHYTARLFGFTIMEGWPGCCAPIPNHLEQRGYAPATVNLRLAAVRRIADEAADAGLLSPELAAGIRRVKGVRRIGVRLGNWLTPEQGRRLLECTTLSTSRELRDQAMVAMLTGCGLRRAELLGLRLESIQKREEHG